MKFLILSLLVSLAVAEKVRYDGYQTLRIEPKGEIQNDYINHLADSLDEQFDFWSHVPNAHTDVMMPPNLVEGFKTLLESHDVDYQVMIEDVQVLITEQANVGPSAAFDYEVYHSYDEIQQWVEEMASTYSIATKFQIATSFEGRQINALKISTGNFGDKKVVYWQAGIHAREWISPATLMYITNQMLEDRNNVLDRKYFDNFDFVIVPSLNVDGYVYTQTDRMWRKTRNTNGFSTCKGVDPNRNYEFKWNGGSGSSSNKCSDTYRGTSAHSEPEVAESTAFLKGLGEVACFIDFHAYSQLWLAPWSYSKTAGLPAETSHQIGGAEAACSALRSVHGTSYTSGPSARTLYAADGCSVDWGHGTLGAKYSYVVELRDTGSYGFLLPENQILPTGQETYAGVKALLDYMIANP